MSAKDLTSLLAYTPALKHDFFATVALLTGKLARPLSKSSYEMRDFPEKVSPQRFNIDEVMLLQDLPSVREEKDAMSR